MAKKSATKSKSTHVHVDEKRLEKLKTAAHRAGVAKDFRQALGKTKKKVFVQIERKKFKELKKLAAKHAHLDTHLSDCDCDPNDPFCICL